MRMALIEQRSGCKVGWETYDVEAEAQAASERSRTEAERKWARGYDFGYQVPGGITHVADHPTYGREVWIVTTP